MYISSTTMEKMSHDYDEFKGTLVTELYSFIRLCNSIVTSCSRI